MERIDLEKGTTIELPSPLLSILDAVLTVSPNRQYLGIFKPTTPATQGPEIATSLSYTRLRMFNMRVATTCNHVHSIQLAAYQFMNTDQPYCGSRVCMFQCYSYLNERKDSERNFSVPILEIRNKKENEKFGEIFYRWSNTFENDFERRNAWPILYFPVLLNKC